MLPNFDRKEAFKNYFRRNRYSLDDRFVLNDGEKHPFVVICPGGGYSMVCSFVEGVPVAKEFNKMGYSAFIVFYRVRKKAHYPNPQCDLAKAIKYILDHQEQYNLIDNNYTLVGFSAGGHLAASFCTKNVGYLQYNLPKPNALILGYPVTSMEKHLAHESTYYNLLGKNAESSLEKEYTIYFHVDEDFPTTYIATGAQDELVDPKNTTCFEESLVVHGVKCGVVFFRGLPHGFGTGEGTVAENWLYDAITFIKQDD